MDGFMDIDMQNWVMQLAISSHWDPCFVVSLYHGMVASYVHVHIEEQQSKLKWWVSQCYFISYAECQSYNNNKITQGSS